VFTILNLALARGEASALGRPIEGSSKFSEAVIELESQKDPDFLFKYEKAVQEEQDLQGELERELRKRLEDKKYLRTISTRLGYNIAYVDLRGGKLELLTGAPGKIAGILRGKDFSSDFVVILTDEEDIDRPDTDFGPKVLITSVSEEGRERNLLTLAKRLNRYENWYGKKPTIELEQSLFGGHKGIVASGPEGTQLDYREVLAIIQDMFEYERYDTPEEFEEAAKSVADLLRIKNYEITPKETIRTKYRSPESYIELKVPLYTDKDGEKVRIYESDFELYKAFKESLSGELKADEIYERLLDTHDNQEYNEPKEITQFRRKRAREVLDNSLKFENIQGVLNALEDLNQDFVTRMDPECKIQILKMISRSDKAISRVYNETPDTTRQNFPIPSWMDPRQASFKFAYLPAKVDRYLIDKMHEEVSQGIVEKDLFSSCLISILESDTYKEAH